MKHIFCTLIDDYVTYLIDNIVSLYHCTYVDIMWGISNLT